MYIVITGDLKSSKKIDNRSLSQDNLKKAIHEVNSNFNKYIVSDFRITGGDGFQGMVSTCDIIIDIYFSLFETINHPFYLGIGIGPISTPLSNYVQEIDGEAFHLSSEALTTAKKKNRWLVFRSNLRNNDLIECIFNFTFDIMWSWTDRRKEIILFYRKHDENTIAIKKAAYEFNIGTRSIYKALEEGKYSMIKYGVMVLENELSMDETHDPF
ncbi:SatD family protein [uncultured Methanobacterium sp.]|uniref:SatD family protein n=1 Tax=uncultured Methanobacterium sp. TaxID=176306 RepID=UPI002AA733A3|nr:SatD family protein [uncultured Methanobacterium sp.]